MGSPVLTAEFMGWELFHVEQKVEPSFYDVRQPLRSLCFSGVQSGMNLSLLFWILYILAVVFSVWSAGPANPKVWGGSLLFFVLIGILGWAEFGAAIKH